MGLCFETFLYVFIQAKYNGGSSRADTQGICVDCILGLDPWSE